MKWKENTRTQVLVSLKSSKYTAKNHPHICLSFNGQQNVPEDGPKSQQTLQFLTKRHSSII